MTKSSKIRFSWGGSGGEYNVFLRSVPGLSPVYEPVIFALNSCYEAQQAVYRLNGALKLWTPDLLDDGAEVEGSGFEYPRPEEVDV